VAYLEPVFDELNAAVDNEQLELGADFEETAILLLRAEAHDMFDAGSVVPAAVEDHDLARGGKVRDIALQIQLSFLAIGRRRQRPRAEPPWAHPLRDGFDRPALAGGVTPFEDDDDAEAVVPHPILQRTELDLQFAQFRFIFLSLHRLAPGCARRSGAVSRHW